MHLRCQAMSPDGFNCMKSVKDGNPEKFKYCSDHGCKYPHCENVKHEGSKGCCTRHCCLAAPRNSCDKPRLVDDGSFFCEVHTCEAQTCTAEVAGKGEKGDASRSCESHRRCAREGCSARCHTRDTGTTVKWCGLHYCQEASCQSDRAPGNKQYCREHICMEPMCANGKLDMGAGRYCMDHQCKTDRCLERRDQRTPGSEHCTLHICWVGNCPKPATAGKNRCDDHRYCREQGCKEYIFIEKGPEGEIKYPTCENRESPVHPLHSEKARELTPWTTDHKTQCPATNLGGNRCGSRLEKDQPYCKDHSCELGSCRNQRGFASLQYCEAHKCTVAACQQLRKNTMAGLDLASGSLRASLLLGGGGFLGGDGGGALLMSSYCAAHACAGDGGRCGDRVAGLGRNSFCPRHECCHRGCANEATRQPRRRSSTAGYCDRHYQRRRAGGGCGMPGGPLGPGPGPGPVPVPMGMPMGMPMGGFPPCFGGQGYDSSDSGSESDGGRRPRGLPLGGLAF
ncbi:hypothetical protein UCDDA912_g09253 [Diaporthe ampelina]|uniref:Uncharacterized protein n=1 Tax=Diaporthe ampelina TaxID=1214573 RepID=A0A0G2F805_9PEZI|nr:hypothetical protein UCDDA912_g09253 [Diaporthe ampelina]